MVLVSDVVGNIAVRCIVPTGHWKERVLLKWRRTSPMTWRTRWRGDGGIKDSARRWSAVFVNSDAMALTRVSFRRNLLHTIPTRKFLYIHTSSYDEDSILFRHPFPYAIVWLATVVDPPFVNASQGWKVRVALINHHCRRSIRAWLGPMDWDSACVSLISPWLSITADEEHEGIDDDFRIGSDQTR